MEVFTAAGFSALLQVIAIDLVLAGDNAIVIGLAAAGLPVEQRRRAILIGIIAATVLRIGFAADHPAAAADRRPAAGRRHPAAVGLLEDVARIAHVARPSAMPATKRCPTATSTRTARLPAARRARRLMQAALQIVIADVSMSLDNVLAVAGAARDHPTVLVIGLILSIALMGIAANYRRATAAPLSLDRLCRPGDHPLCRGRHGLPRRGRTLARRRDLMPFVADDDPSSA